MTYDELGRMQQKTLHQDLLSGSFAYNIRGWLTSIASPVFNEQLYYQEAQSGQTPCYNGNISSLSWGYCGRTDKAYGFSYDQLNRLTEAVYSPDESYNEVVDEYDLNGNIQSLSRSGYVHDGISMDPIKGLIDDLTYQYEGNRLVRVEDNVEEQTELTSNDFKDADSSVEYLYDACGNMTGDFNRGIAWIKYNCLHLPSTIQFSNGNKSSYAYDATGMKRSVQHAFSLSGIQIPFGADTIENTQSIQSLSQTDYCGNFIYEDAQLCRILTPEGYIETTDSTGSTVNTGNWRLTYFLKDHLGNVRARIACPEFDNPIPSSAPSSPPSSPAYTLLDTTDYYPFGLEISSPEGFLTSGNNPYLYNGKELDRMNGLDMYDYGARFYDPALGRWHVIDNKAEKFYPLTPYTYAANNPIRFIDPDGNVIVDANGELIYENDEWKDNASMGARRIGDAMKATPVGSEQFYLLVDVDYNITLTLDPGKGDGKNMAQVTNDYDKDGIQIKADIVVYEGMAKDKLVSLENARIAMDKGHKVMADQDDMARLANMPITVDEIIGQEGVHESVHATEKGSQVRFEKDYEKREELPRQKEIEAITQTPEYRLKKMETDKDYIQ
ncbi:MAG: RHS repeat-associated core domain-containing protein [Bacteroidales bacterium]|nr:RHS repeat-associated core domain-containing protein [Bacteroidales bacterium]MDD4362528.1 RHS repeat-associated core domain-containing protein [Bacteroidales bacterium]MDD4431443.1 RHS repeat-associated core domain-containing protein [Bacteroidales bacterium]